MIQAAASIAKILAVSQSLEVAHCSILLLTGSNITLVAEMLLRSQFEPPLREITKCLIYLKLQLQFQFQFQFF